ncbi:MAG: dTMP kinase [Firmicutes bacterium]|nr:dTMP kinase [Bacillota bacterium]
MKGLFISIEGPDGAGKTTQAARLARALEAAGRRVVCVREPGGTGLGEEIRAILLDGSRRVAPVAEMFLYLAARAQLVAREIRPALERGCTVVSDRYLDSTVAYQGFGRGIDLASLEAANRLATGGLVPHLTVLLDLPVEVALGRVGRRDRLEGEDLSFHHRVREGYLWLARRDPGRIRVVDARGTVSEVFEAVWRAVREAL